MTNWSALKSSNVGSSINIGTGKHTFIAVCSYSSTYVCIYDLKNKKVLYNSQVAILVKSYSNGVIQTYWSDGDPTATPFNYLYL